MDDIATSNALLKTIVTTQIERLNKSVQCQVSSGTAVKTALIYESLINSTMDGIGARNSSLVVSA